MRRSVLLLPIAFAACSQPFEGRIAASLAEAGLSRPVSECMAERWVKKLSLMQLRRIESLAGELRDERGRLGPGRLIARLREIDDPEIVEVVTRSSLVCALTA
jgi:hypothetical protein